VTARRGVVKAFVVAGVWCAALAAGADAARLGAPIGLDLAAGPGRAILVDWQDPAALPRQLRNHCTTESWSRRPYCADHCGRGFQVYYCSRDSFGCCRVGHGYCDDRGHLRCHP